MSPVRRQNSRVTFPTAVTGHVSFTLAIVHCGKYCGNQSGPHFGGLHDACPWRVVSDGLARKGDFFISRNYKIGS